MSKLEEYVNLIDASGVVFKFHDEFSRVYVDDNTVGVSGKIYNKVIFAPKNNIDDLFIPSLSNKQLNALNDYFDKKIKAVRHLTYSNGSVDVQKDFEGLILPYDIYTIHLKLPISMGEKLKPWKTGKGMLKNEEAFGLIKKFMVKHNMSKMVVHKPGSAFVDGEIVCGRGSMWFNKW